MSVSAATARLILKDGLVLEGMGLGATGAAPGEVCFNTAMTGYQEILTDPSYAGQIITFTFPHIGNVGANGEDIEDLTPARRAGAVGAVFRAAITAPMPPPTATPATIMPQVPPLGCAIASVVTTAIAMPSMPI